MSATITRAERVVRIRLNTLPSYTPWGISLPRRMPDRMRGPVRLAPQTELTAVRDRVGGVSNVYRHADAGRVDVRTAFGDDLSVSLSDNGLGLAPSRSNRASRAGGQNDAWSGEPTGFGILGMRERVSAVGGYVEAQPRTPGGTLVVATLPASRHPDPSWRSRPRPWSACSRSADRRAVPETANPSGSASAEDVPPTAVLLFVDLSPGEALVQNAVRVRGRSRGRWERWFRDPAAGHRPVAQR